MKKSLLGLVVLVVLAGGVAVGQAQSRHPDQPVPAMASPEAYMPLVGRKVSLPWTQSKAPVWLHYVGIEGNKAVVGYEEETVRTGKRLVLSVCQDRFTRGKDGRWELGMTQCLYQRMFIRWHGKWAEEGL